MGLEEIHALWEADTKIEIDKLDTESLIIPQLHSKYFKLLSTERLRLRTMEAEWKSLRLEKTVFYQDGATEEQIKAGWELPPKGKIIRSDVYLYLDADKDLQKLNLEIERQKEKVALLEGIIGSINNRSFIIKHAIEFQKFMNGL